MMHPIVSEIRECVRQEVEYQIRHRLPWKRARIAAGPVVPAN